MNQRFLDLAECANRNGDTGGIIRRSQHVATSIKNSAGIDDQAWRVNFSGDYTFGLDFDAPLGKNHAVVTAGNDHAIALDLTFDFRVLAENQSLLGDDVALHVA